MARDPCRAVATTAAPMLLWAARACQATLLTALSTTAAQFHLAVGRVR